MNKGFLLIFFICTSFSLCSINEEDKIIQGQPHLPFLYAPWRNSYDTKVTSTKEYEERSEHNCPFCIELRSGNDEKYFILKRGRHCAITLNLFPYATAHMLIIPYEHKSHLNDISEEARTELMDFTNQGLYAVKKAYNFPGANIGINLGRYAGASIPEHLHLQIVPRGYNYQSFMYVIGHTPVIQAELHTVYKTLKKTFLELDKELSTQKNN